MLVGWTVDARSVAGQDFARFQFPMHLYLSVLCVGKDRDMSIRVFSEQNQEGELTGRIQQFCSDACAGEFEDQELTYARYTSELRETPRDKKDKCAACLKSLQPPAKDDRFIVNVEFIGHLRRDSEESRDGSANVGAAEQLKRQIDDEIGTAYSYLKQDRPDVPEIADRAWIVTGCHLPGTPEFEERIRQLEAKQEKNV
ncbi:MAG: hypothetical protein JWL77_4517 [Chthonomonadaceae bacterium]|nr:hypothetical protein [Chthonomonadaceae bacterium]